jgi:hypothetical protein
MGHSTNLNDAVVLIAADDGTLTEVVPMNRLGGRLILASAVVQVMLALPRVGLAQEISYALVPHPGIEAPEPTSSFSTKPIQPAVTLAETSAHYRFWDRENEVLFSASAALSAADFVVTRDNLHSGGQELNPVTRLFTGSTAGLAMNFAGETAGVIGLSYFFHRTGHHKLERAVSMLNIGSSAGAVTYDMSHR